MDHQPDRETPIKKAEEKLGGFFEFIRQQGVIGLAVGIILGNSVRDVVNALIADFISPMIGLMLGFAGNLKDAQVHIGPVSILWGHFVSVVIDFAIVAAVIYFVVKGFKFDKFDKPKS